MNEKQTSNVGASIFTIEHARSRFAEVMMQRTQETLHLPSETLRHEALPVFFSELPTIRHAMVTATLLADTEMKPEGLLITELRSQVAKRLGLHEEAKVQQLLGSPPQFQVFCDRMVGNIIQKDTSQARKTRYFVDPLWQGQAKQYVAGILEYMDKHDIPFETFNARIPSERGPSGLPAKIEAIQYFGDTFFIDGISTGNPVAKQALQKDMGIDKYKAERILLFMEEIRFAQYKKVAVDDNRVFFMLVQPAIFEATSSEKRQDVVDALAELAKQNPYRMYAFRDIYRELVLHADRYRHDYTEEKEQIDLERRLERILSPLMEEEDPSIIRYEKESIAVFNASINDKAPFLDLIDFLAKTKSPEGYLANTNEEGFLSRFQKGENQNEARAFWEKSNNIEPHRREQTESDLKTAALYQLLEHPAGLTRKQLLTVLPIHSGARVSEILNSLADQGFVVRHLLKNSPQAKGKEYLWRLPLQTEKLEIKVVKLLTEGGIIQILPNGIINLVGIHDAQYGHLLKDNPGQEAALQIAKQPVVRTILQDNSTAYIVKQGNFAQEETAAVFSNPKGAVLQFINILDTAQKTQYAKLIAENAVLPPIHTVREQIQLLIKLPPKDTYEMLEVIGNFTLLRDQLEAAIPAVFRSTNPIMEEVAEVQPKEEHNHIREKLAIMMRSDNTLSVPELEELASSLSTTVNYEKYKDLIIAEAPEKLIRLWQRYHIFRQEIVYRKSQKLSIPTDWDDITKKFENNLFILNLPLVHYLVNKQQFTETNGFAINNTLKDRMIQEGSIGLLRAIRYYNVEKAAFSTYAQIVIKQRINEAIKEEMNVLGLPSSIQKEVLEYKKIKIDIERQLGHEPTHEEIVTASRLTIYDVIDYESFLHPKLTGLQAQNEEGELYELPLADAHIQVSPSLSPEALQGLRILVGRYLAVLTPRERVVIERRFGLDDYHVHEYSEIAPILGITTAFRVRDIEKKALAKLRDEAAKYVHIGDILINDMTSTSDVQ